jgi:sugar lactone lactonase YvrE
MQAELVLDARNGTGESPVWLAAEQSLYWVDIPAKMLNRWTPTTGAHTAWIGDEMLACVAPRAGRPGQWIAGMESGLFAIATRDDGTLASTPLTRAPHATHGMRFNDGRCDRQGRFWAGTMLTDMAAGRDVGRLYRYQADVDAEVALRLELDGLLVPNGLAFSPDGRTMYLSDSHPSVQTITYWGIADDGSWLGAPGGFVRKDGTPKPSYDALRSLVKGDWWLAPTTMRTDGAGRVAVSGWLGDYEVSAGGAIAAFALDGTAAVEAHLA